MDELKNVKNSLQIGFKVIFNVILFYKSKNECRGRDSNPRPRGIPGKSQSTCLIPYEPCALTS